MIWTSRLPSINSIFLNNFRNYSNSKEITVSPFCNVIFTALSNITVKPLDAFKYGNSDKLIIRSDNINNLDYLNVKQEHDDIFIDEHINPKEKNVKWVLEAPVKANLKLNSMENIQVSNFNGEFIDLYSSNGNIIVSKCHVDKISTFCNGGNISSTGALQANRINLQCTKYGTISTEKLQGNKLHLKTENGDILINSSYCDETLIETQCGSLTLRNMHRENDIHIYEKGHLKITGFDGTLNATVNDGFTDVQISRIVQNSRLVIEKGDVNLKVGETCQSENSITVKAKECHIHSNVQMTLQKAENRLILGGDEKAKVNLKVKCVNSILNIASMSWAEMFKISLNKQS